jgi:hypothetical protein
MATMTAQILIGSAHQNHGGINPSHFLFLSENSRPAWILTPQNIHPDDRPVPPRVVWIPTPDNLLFDALAMIALHVCRDASVLEAAGEAFEDPLAERLELIDDAKGPLDAMYNACRNIEHFPKLVITLFEDARLDEQLPILDDFTMDVEVCRPTFVRAYSAWTKTTRVEGSLRP